MRTLVPAMFLALGACGSAPTPVPAVNGATGNAFVEMPLPVTVAQDANGIFAANLSATAAPPEVRSAISGRWSPPGVGCDRAVEFRADGAAIRSPGAPPDRWSVERVGSRDMLRVDADNASERMIVESVGATLVLVDARDRRHTLTRC